MQLLISKIEGKINQHSHTYVHTCVNRRKQLNYCDFAIGPILKVDYNNERNDPFRSSGIETLSLYTYVS